MQPNYSRSDECIVAELIDHASTNDHARLRGMLRKKELAATATSWRSRPVCPDISAVWPYWGAQGELSAMHFAAANGHLEALAELHANGADAHATSRVGATPLMLAAHRGHADAVRYLAALESSSPPVGDTLRHLSIGLLSPGLYSPLEARGPTAMHLAACSPNQEGGAACVQALLDAGASPHVTSFGGLTPLHLAAASRSATSCALLVRAGSSCTLPDASGRTALDYARRHESESLGRQGDGHEAHSEASELERLQTLRELSFSSVVRQLWIGNLKSPGSRLAGLSGDVIRCMSAHALHPDVDPRKICAVSPAGTLGARDEQNASEEVGATDLSTERRVVQRAERLVADRCLSALKCRRCGFQSLPFPATQL